MVKLGKNCSLISDFLTKFSQTESMCANNRLKTFLSNQQNFSKIFKSFQQRKIASACTMIALLY